MQDTKTRVTMGEADFDSIMACLDPPMVVVTAALGDELAGCLVGFHTQSSIGPRRFCLWMSKANHTYRVVEATTHLAVHYLTADDIELARHFGTLSGDDVDKLDPCTYETGPEGLPLLMACPNRLVGHHTALLDDGGDHVCVTVEPIAVGFGGPFTPLRLSDVADLVAGHEPEDRPAPPTERDREPAGSSRNGSRLVAGLSRGR